MGIARVPDAVSIDDYVGGGCGLLTAVHIAERGRIGDVLRTDREHSRNILHHDEKRVPALRGVQELAVEGVPRILLEPVPVQAVELRTANPGESLAGRSPDEDVGPLITDETPERDPLHIPHRSVRRTLRLETGEVPGKGLHRHPVEVDPGPDDAARRVEPEREAPCPREQVHHSRSITRRPSHATSGARSRVNG